MRIFLAVLFVAGLAISPVLLHQRIMAADREIKFLKADLAENERELDKLKKLVYHHDAAILNSCITQHMTKAELKAWREGE